MDCSDICLLDGYSVFNFEIFITVSHKRCTPTKPQSPPKNGTQDHPTGNCTSRHNLKIAIKSKAKTQKEPVQ